MKGFRRAGEGMVGVSVEMVGLVLSLGVVLLSGLSVMVWVVVRGGGARSSAVRMLLS